jgi:hypothetical protein
MYTLQPLKPFADAAFNSHSWILDLTIPEPSLLQPLPCLSVNGEFWIRPVDVDEGHNLSAIQDLRQPQSSAYHSDTRLREQVQKPQFRSIISKAPDLSLKKPGQKFAILPRKCNIYNATHLERAFAANTNCGVI